MKILELRENVTNSNGITLVALVISIIVLLILATVTIQTLTGNNGLLTKAETAVQSNKDSQELEKIKLAVLSAQMKNGGKILTAENLNAELQANLNDDTTTAEKIGNDWYYKEYVIYENGNVEKYDKLLPKEYQQVEYIESTGTQYIDTGIIPKATMKVNLEVSQLAFTNKSAGLIGENSWKYSLVIYQQNQLRWVSGDAACYNYSIDNTKTYNIECIPDGEMKVNDTSTERISDYGNGSPNRTWWLFTGQNGVASSFRLKYCKIYDNGTLVRNFIPCYQKPGGESGLYDTVEGKFYTNQGTGNFKIPLEKYSLQQVEYIESTGTQYIDTGIIPKATMKVNLEVSQLAFTNKSAGLIGENSWKYSLVIYQQNQLRWVSGDAACYNYSIDNTKTYNIECIPDGEMKVNDTSTERISDYGNGSPNRTWWLFTGQNGVASSFRLKYCKIYDNGTLVRNFIPCYQKPGGESGLYDTVEGKFYTNQGTGSFLKGNDV